MRKTTSFALAFATGLLLGTATAVAAHLVVPDLPGRLAALTMSYGQLALEASGETRDASLIEQV